ncbi:ABC transporter permease [Dehalococcoidia bacterium]|nr:ABC transporter permease [Dehalococcoidia bacterium]MCL0063847.1 ABC transporter permease [Dehalococcoidia bacterium]MCL0072721.1 ABC transporter permease [Dehalococcoidia bacterium]
MIEAWQFLMRNPEVVAGWTLEHLWIVLVACGFAVILGVPLGIYISGRGREHIADAVLYLAEIMMTVPSLALFGLLMAILASLGLRAIGFTPAIIALIIYAQLPILRNTYTAIRQVDPAMIEAGKGMGMSERQLLFKVKLPLSVPVIMAGVRNAVVMTIAIAAIAAIIGAGGLGEAIWWGLRGARMDLILVGGIGVSILGLLADAFMSRVERWVTPKGLRM